MKDFKNFTKLKTKNGRRHPELVSGSHEIFFSNAEISFLSVIVRVNLWLKETLIPAKNMRG